MPESHDTVGSEQQALSAPEAEAIATLGYIYGYPLVLMDVTRSLSTSPFNRFTHMPAFPDHTFTDVVSPNVDTLYSMAWLELSPEPIVLAVPDLGQRYYTMQLLDAWTNVFAAPGTRTTGSGKGAFAIVCPGWRGNVPAAVEAIQSPTNMVWLLGRTYTAGKGDYDAVHAIQQQYTLMPLSKWAKAGAQPAAGQAPGVVSTPPSPSAAGEERGTPPVTLVEKMSADAFFARLAQLMKANPPTEHDAPLVNRLVRLGVIPGEPFDLERLPPSVADAIESGVAAARARINGAPMAALGQAVNGWRVRLDLGRTGTDYELRAGVALMGLGVNLADDAVYFGADSDGAGQPLSGANRYVIRFPPGELPPARAFWSVTLYDNRHYLAANPIGRHAIGDRDPVRAERDGALEIYLQPDDPGEERRANWLPTPDGAFNVIMRLYYPKATALDGRWKPPPITRA